MHVICSCTKAEMVVEFKVKNQKSYIIPTFLFCQSINYERPVRELPSLHGRKFTPIPKFLGTEEAYFVCHIGPNFQISFDLCLHWVFVVCVSELNTSYLTNAYIVFYPQNRICIYNYNFWHTNDGEKLSTKNIFEIPPCRSHFFLIHFT
jgi:hypothetical protein